MKWILNQNSVAAALAIFMFWMYRSDAKAHAIAMRAIVKQYEETMQEAVRNRDYMVSLVKENTATMMNNTNALYNNTQAVRDLSNRAHN